MRFDIAMNNLPFVRMQVDKRVEQLVGPGDDGVARHWPWLLGNYFGEVEAFDELHNEKCTVAFSKVITDARQRGMIEPGHQAGLPLKLFPLFFVIRERLL